MKKKLRSILLTIVTLCAYHTHLFSQSNDAFIEGAIYLKVQKADYKGIFGDKTVNIAYELPFLVPLTSSIESKAKPFSTSKTEDIRRIYRLEFAASVAIDSLINVLKQNPSVEYVEKIRLRKIISTPNDTDVSSQWSLAKINAFTAWDIAVPSGQATVAIVDNAFQVNHPDLAANMVAGYDVSDNDTDPSPPNTSFAHGTHVAGIVSAVTNNSLGIAAAAYNRVKIMPIKATPNTGDYRGIYDGYEGIQWAIDHGASIISLSWGGTGYSQTEQDVINSAFTNGILVIAAAGNDDNEVLNYPASYSHVISVASTDNADKKSWFSSFGTSVDISAPGSAILSTIPFDTYASYNGTSMATPLVASVCGYVKSAYPTMTPTDLENLLKNTADNIEAQNPNYIGKMGAGRVNLQKMVGCKNSNLSSVTITAQSSTYICPGQNVVFSTPTVASATYQWYKNDAAIINATTNQFTATEAGTYKIKVQLGNCGLYSNTKQVQINTLKTPTPIVSSVETFYCDQLNVGDGLKVTPITCQYSGPQTANYTGAVVGYDGFEQSNADPTAETSNLGGTISDVKVSITWQKKDAYTFISCGDADGGGVPYNEEVAFSLVSPSGKKIILIAAGTYARGTTTSGIVTTQFSMSGSIINSTDLPQTGIFKPQGDFSTLYGDIPNGKWTLLASDDSYIDPLCVSAFSVTITTNATTAPPVVKWYSDSNTSNLVFTGTEYLPVTTSLGVSDYYIKSKCDGICESNPAKASLFVKTVPYIVAFPLPPAYTSSSDKLTLKSINKTNNTVSVTIENTANATTSTFDAPLESPVTFCQSKLYVVVATGCGGTVKWNSGETGEGDLIFVSNTYSVSAECIQNSVCPAIAPATFNFINGNNANSLNLSTRVLANSNQAFSGATIQSVQKINTASRLDYNATQYILLKPGFETIGSPTFKAEIRGCQE